MPRPWGELAAATYDDQDAAVADTAARVDERRLRRNWSLATPAAALTPCAGAKASTLGMRFIVMVLVVTSGRKKLHTGCAEPFVTLNEQQWSSLQSVDGIIQNGQAPYLV